MTLGEMTSQALENARSEFRALVADRRDKIATLRRRDGEVATAEALHARRQTTHDEWRETAEAAAERREHADADVEREGQNLVQSWQTCIGGLKQLQIGPDDGFAMLATLAEWLVSLDGDNPARQRLQVAQQQTSERLAGARVSLDGRRRALEAERTTLDDERSRLEGGVDTMPPQPHTRADDVRNSREGAPLWQLVEFRAALTIPQRAGLEAALEAAGLLDAWLSPDGSLRSGDDDAPLFDTQMLARARQSPSLADWLQADVPADSPVPATVVEHLLAGIACADDDPTHSETWIAADGRFRLGALGGAWTKPEAVYIGYAARAAARARRLTEISARLAQLDNELAAVQEGADQLDKDQNQAAEEWHRAPADEMLRNSHLAAAAAAREADTARQRWAEAAVQRDGLASGNRSNRLQQ